MWEERSNELVKSYTFKDFNEAFGFMSRVALLCERANHHPSWTNTWNKVEIHLSTHDAGHKVTSKDRNLAKEIDDLIQS
jgi:4a-hydroxytetrahydrobiopterin dehydratase